MHTEDIIDRQDSFSPIRDPLFFFRSSRSDSLFQHLTYLMRNNQNILILLGEQGVGKTITLIEIMNRLDSRIKFFFLSAKHLNFQDIVREFCDRSGFLPMTEGEWPTRQLLDHDLRNNDQKKNPYTLIFDDAHTYGDEILKKLLLLSVSPSVKKSVFKIVLSGLPELRTRIDQLNLHPVEKHDIDYYGLENMEASDVGDFIRQPLNTASSTDTYSFTPNAVSRIYHYSKGNPGLITKICGLARTIAGNHEKTVVTAEIIDKVGDELFLPSSQKATNYQQQENTIETVERIADHWNNETKNVLQTEHFLSKSKEKLKGSQANMPKSKTMDTKEDNIVQRAKKELSSKVMRYFALVFTVVIAASIVLFYKANTSFLESIPKSVDTATKSGQEKLATKSNITKIKPRERNVAAVKPQKSNLAEVVTRPPKKAELNPTVGKNVRPGDVARQFIRDLKTNNQPVNLDLVYREGVMLNMRKQPEDAYLLFFYAARQGHGFAAFRLAQLYDPAFFKPGVGMIDTPDLNQASKWYGRAVDAGHAAAVPFLEKIRAQILESAANGDEKARRLTVQY